MASELSRKDDIQYCTSALTLPVHRNFGHVPGERSRAHPHHATPRHTTSGGPTLVLGQALVEPRAPPRQTPPDLAHTRRGARWAPLRQPQPRSAPPPRPQAVRIRTAPPALSPITSGLSIEAGTHSNTSWRGRSRGPQNPRTSVRSRERVAADHGSPRRAGRRLFSDLNNVTRLWRLPPAPGPVLCQPHCS